MTSHTRYLTFHVPERDESGLHRDYKRWLEELVPSDPSPETERRRASYGWAKRR